MSDPNDQNEYRRRGREDARSGETNDPQDWDARQAYRAGQQQHDTEQAWKTYSENVFSVLNPTSSATGESQFSLFGCLGALWFLAYYSIGAVVVASVAQSLVKMIAGPGLIEGVAAVVGLIGGMILIAWGFGSFGLFRKLYAGLLGLGMPLLTAAALLFGNYQTTPMMQRLAAIAAVSVVFGGASWLTYRYIDRRAQ